MSKTQWTVGLMLIVAASSGWAAPHGDVNGDGALSVIDVQCAINVALAELEGAALPGCVAAGAGALIADLDCTLAVDVGDIIVGIQLALGAPLSAAIDNDASGIPDACECSPDACDDGDVCTADTCDGPSCLHTPLGGACGWVGAFAHSSQNPIVWPSAAHPIQGADNVYAPSVLRRNGQWWMWYGAQGSDGHDRIFVAQSADLVSWQKWPSFTNPAPVIDNGTANHVNDPSVVEVQGQLYMAYTVAEVGIDDRVHWASSTDGLSWTTHGEIIGLGPAGAWDHTKIGRPSLTYDAETEQFVIWYDGQLAGSGRHTGIATSPDGVTWTKHPANPVLLNQGAVDVSRFEDLYVLLSEGFGGTHLFVSATGFDWQYRGLVLGLSGSAYDAFGQVTPHLVYDPTSGAPVALLYGGASDGCWCKNRVSIAFAGADIPGCAACLAGAFSCQQACELGGSDTGWCGAPGSANADACCTCEGAAPPPPPPPPANCSGCLGGAADCNQACQLIGHPSGTCANPGSTNPGACCACAPATGCEGCLVGHASCQAACQNAGASTGWCAAPGSTNPSACCACQ